MKKNLDLNEGAHFDFIQTFSGQNLCKAKIQLYCMARNNLFPKILKAYPESTSFKRIFLGYFVKQKFSSLILNKKDKKNNFYFYVSDKNSLLKNKFTQSFIVRNYKKYLSFFDHVS